MAARIPGSVPLALSVDRGGNISVLYTYAIPSDFKGKCMDLQWLFWKTQVWMCFRGWLCVRAWGKQCFCWLAFSTELTEFTGFSPPHMHITFASHTFWHAILNQLCFWRYIVLFYLFLWTNNQCLTILAKSLTSIKTMKDLFFLIIISKYRCEAHQYSDVTIMVILLRIKKKVTYEEIFSVVLCFLGRSFFRLWCWDLSVQLIQDFRMFYWGYLWKKIRRHNLYKSGGKESFSHFLGLSHLWKMCVFF